MCKDNDTTEQELSFFEKCDGDDAYFLNLLLLKKLKEMYAQKRFCATLTKKETATFGSMLYLSKENMKRAIENTENLLDYLSELICQEDILKEYEYIERVRSEKKGFDHIFH